MTNSPADALVPQDGESGVRQTPPGEAMTERQLAEAREYGRRELQVALFDMALDVAFLGVMAFGVAVALDHWLQQWPLLSSRWSRLAMLYLITMGLHYCVSFPVSFYSGFLLEHQYRLSRQSLGRWLWRYGLQNALVVVLGLVLIEGLYAIIWWSGIWWWFVAALATFVVTVLLGQLLPVLILPLFYQIERLEDDALTGRLERLIDGTSLSLEGVYRMKLSSETVKANALLAGLGRTRRVILGDTLLEQFTAEEIEVVFAHEVGHHVHRHISKLMLLGFFTSILGYLASDGALRWWVWYQEGAFGYHELPVYTLPLILFMVTVISLISSPMRNALSRRFETQCDRYALRRTRNPVAYRGAFSKLAQLNKADPQPHPWEVWLMHDHPPIAARLALAEGWDVEAVDS